MFWRKKYSQLDRIEAYLRYLVHKENRMALTIDDLKAAVAAQTTVVDSTKALLKRLHDELVDAHTTQNLSALPEMINLLNQNTEGLAAAVAANTVAASEPPAPAPAPVTPPAATAPDAPAPAAPDAPSA